MPPKQAKLTYDQEAELQFQLKIDAAEKQMSPQQKKVVQLFKDYDSDRNEKISKTEFRQILVACHMPRDKVTQLFDAVDTNHDGAISVKEMMFWILGNARGGGNAGREIKEHMNRPSDPEEAKGYFLDFCKNDLCRNADSIVSSGDYEGQVFFKSHEKAAFCKKKGINEKDLETREVSGDDYPAALDSLFKQFDSNGNAYISMNELVVTLQSYGFNCHKKVIELMFRSLDGFELKEKDLVTGPRTRQIEAGDAKALSTGTLKYSTLTTKMKDGALDKLEFMEIFGQEMKAGDIENLPDEVKMSAEQRAAAGSS